MLIHQSGKRLVRQFALHSNRCITDLATQIEPSEIEGLIGEIIDTWPLCPRFASRWVDELTLLRDQGER
jgi:hypothetical protein